MVESIKVLGKGDKLIIKVKEQMSGPERARMSDVVKKLMEDGEFLIIEGSVEVFIMKAGSAIELAPEVDRVLRDEGVSVPSGSEWRFVYNCSVCGALHYSSLEVKTKELENASEGALLDIALRQAEANFERRHPGENFYKDRFRRVK